MLEKLRELSEEIVIRTEKDTKYGTAIMRTPTPVIKLDKAIELFKELQENLEISEKALELACDWFMTTGFLGDQTKVSFYKQLAKKEMKSE